MPKTINFFFFQIEISCVFIYNLNVVQPLSIQMVPSPIFAITNYPTMRHDNESVWFTLFYSTNLPISGRILLVPIHTKNSSDHDSCMFYKITTTLQSCPFAAFPSPQSSRVSPRAPCILQFDPMNFYKNVFLI